MLITSIPVHHKYYFRIYRQEAGNSWRSSFKHVSTIPSASVSQNDLSWKYQAPKSSRSCMSASGTGSRPFIDDVTADDEFWHK